MAESHVRIDEGIKRGPRKPRVDSRAAKGLTPKPRPDDLGSWKIPPDLNPDDVIHRYLTAATTSQIAASYGLSRRALVKWLRTERPEQWREAQIIRAHDKLEQAEDALEVADDAISLARPREVAKAMQYRLTALDKDYQPKQEVTVKQELRIETVLDGEACALLSKIRARSVAHTPNAALLQPIIDVEPTSNES